MDRFLRLGPCILYHLHIFRVRFLGADFYEAASHLLHDEFVAERLDGVEFAVMPRSLQELQHQNSHPLADGPQRCTHCGGGLSLAWTGVHDDETTAKIRHNSRISYSTGWDHWG